MSKNPEQFAGPWLESMVRFAYLYLGDMDLARESVRSAIIAIAPHAEDGRDAKKCGRHLMSHVRRQCMQRSALKQSKVKETQGNIDADDVQRMRVLPPTMDPDWFADLPEPQRSAGILFYLDALDARDIEKIVGINQDTLGLALRDVRLRFADKAQRTVTQSMEEQNHA